MEFTETLNQIGKVAHDTGYLTFLDEVRDFIRDNTDPYGKVKASTLIAFLNESADLLISKTKENDTK